MAYPTTLALIAALWGPGPGRTRSIALWAAIGGAISVSGPLLSGLLLQFTTWPWVFWIVIPLAVVALWAGLPALGWGLVWLVIALAALNLFLGFCVGCFVYYQLNKLGLPGFRVSPMR